MVCTCAPELKKQQRGPGMTPQNATDPFVRGDGHVRFFSSLDLMFPLHLNTLSPANCLAILVVLGTRCRLTRFWSSRGYFPLQFRRSSDSAGVRRQNTTEDSERRCVALRWWHPLRLRPLYPHPGPTNPSSPVFSVLSSRCMYSVHC